MTTCDPTYSFRPTFTPSSISCVAPKYNEHRASVTTTMDNIGQLFFRSHSFGFIQNTIEVEITSDGKFNVWQNGTVVEQYDVSFTPGSIAALRLAITNRHIIPSDPPASVIDMPVLNYDIRDLRTEENDSIAVPPALVDGGLSPMTRIALSGGEGAPADSSTLSLIRTGPDRSIFILITTEDDQGNSINSPSIKSN